MALRKLIAGNWKMHGQLAMLVEIEEIGRATRGWPVDVAICPPATLIAAAVALQSGVAIGAQDAHAAVAGAYTGCLSTAMLVEAGATLCIVGHSERRAFNHETDAIVRAKAEAVAASGMTPIICVGETRADYEAGRAIDVIVAHLAGSLPNAHGALIVSYEPVWAIGSGRTPSVAEIATMHGVIREIVGLDIRILYGGSVNRTNAAELLAIDNVDGALVGGASLTAAAFVPIVEAAVAALGPPAVENNRSRG